MTAKIALASLLIIFLGFNFLTLSNNSQYVFAAAAQEIDGGGGGEPQPEPSFFNNIGNAFNNVASGIGGFFSDLGSNVNKGLTNNVQTPVLSWLNGDKTADRSGGPTYYAPEVANNGSLDLNSLGKSTLLVPVEFNLGNIINAIVKPDYAFYGGGCFLCFDVIKVQPIRPSKPTGVPGSTECDTPDCFTPPPSCENPPCEPPPPPPPPPPPSCEETGTCPLPPPPGCEATGTCLQPPVNCAASGTCPPLPCELTGTCRTTTPPTKTCQELGTCPTPPPSTCQQRGDCPVVVPPSATTLPRPGGGGGGTPPICSGGLSANPQNVNNPGDKSALSWSCSPSSCAIDKKVGSGPWTFVSGVPNSGSKDVFPTSGTTYRLTCTNARGPSSYQTTVGVIKVQFQEVNPTITP